MYIKGIRMWLQGQFQPRERDTSFAEESEAVVDQRLIQEQTHVTEEVTTVTGNAGT